MAKVLRGSVAVLLVLAFFFVAQGYTGSWPMLFRPSEALVDKDVAMVLICGEQPKAETVNQTAWAPLKYAYQGGG